MKLDYVIQWRTFKGHVKIVKICMVKFNVSVSNRPKITVFFLIIKHMHEQNNSFNRTLTKLVTILTKCFFPYLNPKSYLNHINSLLIMQKNLFDMWFCLVHRHLEELYQLLITCDRYTTPFFVILLSYSTLFFKKTFNKKKLN